jgi:hypothetical protein
MNTKGSVKVRQSAGSPDPGPAGSGRTTVVRPAAGTPKTVRKTAVPLGVGFAPFLALLLAVLLAVLLTGCLPVSDLREIDEIDLRPPVLLGVSVPSSREVRIAFDQEVRAEREEMRITPNLPMTGLVLEGSEVILTLEEDQALGIEYYLEGRVEDENGNSMSFITPFYGYNPRVPDLVINEFTTQGSGNHPDIVEIAVLSEGNLAGVTLYEGTRTDYDGKKVLPPREVEPGEFLLVHFKPEGIPDEEDETVSPDTSGGLDASPEAWDFWVDGGSGLSGNNGVIALYGSPAGILLDGVLYSNRTSASDERYRGFGSTRVLGRAENLFEEEGWTAAGELIAPEDAVDPEPSTATRSMCRDSSSADTDRREDWHIVPTGGYTFGGVNSDEVHIP